MLRAKRASDFVLAWAYGIVRRLLPIERQALQNRLLAAGAKRDAVDIDGNGIVKTLWEIEDKYDRSATERVAGSIQREEAA